MKDNFLLKQLAQAVVDSCIHSYDDGIHAYCHDCVHCDTPEVFQHKPHCIVLVAEQILKGNEE